VSENLDRRFDVLVVGSGASGSIAVKELTERGLDVLLLEAGRDITEADFVPPPAAQPSGLGIGLKPRAKAALRGQWKQARRAFYSDKTTPFLISDRENPYTSDGEDFLWIRGRQLGGRLHAYGRVLLRMSDYDFEGSEDGRREKWPIRYSDLEPWYDRVEEFIGLYGNADGVPHLPDGKYRGGANLTTAEKDFAATTEERWPTRKGVAWRFQAPNLHRVPLGIVAARETGRLTTRTDAVVRRITTDERTGLADGAVFVDRHTKKEHRVFADVVMLCASTIESVRILLNSGSSRHPDGLGNSSGLLGRYFMDQTPGLTFGSSTKFQGFEQDKDAPADPYYGPSGGVYIPMVDDFGPNSGFEGGYAVQGVIGRLPVPEGEGAAFGMMSFGEMLPYHFNRVTIDPRRKDKWGVPVPRIHISLTDNERGLLREQARGVREMMEHWGGRVNFSGSTLGLDSPDVFPDADPISRMIFRIGFKKSLAIGAAIHECGGAKMGSDPAESVLNEYNQSWDVPNLFVTDASCYVSNGIVGPTLSIMALTARTSEYIEREHASGSLTNSRRA
jgi:choline dehydrogenase-like flavoprotein